MTDSAVSFALPSRTTLVDEIVAAVADRIVRGELEPGRKIRQQELAELLGVSRTPLREAFQRLDANGWVRLEARRGATVRALTVAEAEEIFTMRVVLETVAARLAASAHSERDAERVRALLDAETAPDDRGAGGVEGGNLAFHELVYGLDAPATPVELASAVRGYWTRALRYRLVYWSRPEAVVRSRAAHEAIEAAWRRRDPDATECAVADHILTALRQITAEIEPGHEPSHAVRALALRYRVESDF